jgi:hypothetical protein
MMRSSGNRDLAPQSGRLVVIGIDGDEELVLRSPNSFVIRFQASEIASSLK